MLDKGFEYIESFISNSETEVLIKDLSSIKLSKTSGGIRNIEKKSNAVKEFISSKIVLQTVSKYLGNKPSFIRAIFFNKTPKQNWLVSWHQDKTVSVSKKFAADGWHSWSTKDEILHVQPPLEVLNQMVTLRVHLDESNRENGCLKVMPSSHELGILSQSTIDEYATNNQSIDCAARKGSALVMRPHLLHSSSKGTKPSQRRILHLEFSSYQLPTGVNWS